MKSKIIITLATVAVAFLAGCCLKMSDLTPGTSYSVGDVITTSRTDIVVEKFQWGTGVWTSTGSAKVDNRNYAMGSGYDLNPRNVNLRFKFAYPLKKISMKFGELGGNNNIEVNGEFRNVADLVSLNGTSIGGVHATVSASQTGSNWYGNIVLEGPINDFAIGGQELWLDDVCTSK